MLFKIVYLLACRLLGLAILAFRGDRAKDAGLLVLRHENAVLRRCVGRVRYEPGDRVWFAGEPRPMRYSELLRLLAGVSQKMLTQTLRSLERDGLVIRTVTPTVPVTVTYELTDLGLSLHPMMRGIKTWAETHMDDVLANREAHDTHTT